MDSLLTHSMPRAQHLPDDSSTGKLYFVSRQLCLPLPLALPSFSHPGCDLERQL